MTTLNENKDASQMPYNSEYSGVAIQQRIQWCCHTTANTVVLLSIVSWAFPKICPNSSHYVWLITRYLMTALNQTVR